MKKTIAVLAAAMCAVLSPGQAQLIFTQYYEGPSTNKWLELTNIGTEAIADLSIYAIGQWNNANSEGYKTNVAPTFTLTLSGSLAAGQSLILFNTGNTTPPYALTYTPSLSDNSLVNFNGNDSLGLYTAGTFTTASLIDVIGFTTAGNQGVDKSFVRLNAGLGWNTTAGSSVVDFGSVWQQVTLADVNDAAAATDNRLGYSSVTAVPEPGTIALVALGLGVALFGVRRKRA